MNPLADEFGLIVMAFTGPWRRPGTEPASFGHARESGRGPIVFGLIMLLVFEAIPVHFAVASRQPKLAWWLTASSVYLILWLIGDQQALRLSRSRIVGRTLELRVGYRQRAEIPLEAVAALRTHDLGPLLARKGTVRAVPKPGTPTLALELSAPIAVRGLYGIVRPATAIALAPDERAEFIAALRAAGVAVDPT